MNYYRIKLICLFVFTFNTGPLFAQVPDSLQNKSDSLMAQPATPVVPPITPPSPVVAPAAPAQPAAAVAPSSAAPANQSKRSFSEKFGFGLGTGFWITPSQTYIEVSPSVAYRFPKRLITGVGYRYIYRHDRVIDRDYNSWGPNVFARFDLLKRVYLWTEYETLKSEYRQDDVPSASKETYSVDSWFTGLGWVKSVGRKSRGGVSVQVLYNMLYDDDGRNPYYSPWTYRVGYFF